MSLSEYNKAKERMLNKKSLTKSSCKEQRTVAKAKNSCKEQLQRAVATVAVAKSSCKEQRTVAKSSCKEQLYLIYATLPYSFLVSRYSLTGFTLNPFRLSKRSTPFAPGRCPAPMAQKTDCSAIRFAIRLAIS